MATTSRKRDPVYIAEWMKNNPEKYKKAQQKYRKTEKFDLTRRNNKYLRIYGISLEEYNKLLEKQNYVCAICHCPEKAKSQRKDREFKLLSVDHCHTTGKVRGLLCQRCNISIGHSGDNIIILEKMITYLKENSL